MNYMMRKLLKVMAVLVLMLASMPTHAQVFIQDKETEGLDRTGYEDFGLVTPYQGGDHDQYLPLGEGWLLLTALGGAYLVKKAHKKEEAK